MLLLVACVLVSRPLRAQRTTVWLDAGASTVRQPSSVSRQAGTIGLGAEHRTRRFALTGDGAATMADDSLAATQLVLRAQFAPASWTISDIEASTTTIGFTLPGADGNRALLVRQHVQRGALRLFAGAGIGRTQRFSLDSRSDAQQLGAAATHAFFGGTMNGTLTLQRASTDDWQLIEAAGIVLKAPAPAYQLHDAMFELAWQRARFAISAAHTWRAGFGATRGTGRGHALAASWQALGPLSLVAQGGRQLADPLRGIPQATYVGVMARVQRGRSALPRSRDARTGGVTVFDTVALAEYQLQPHERGGLLTLTIDAPSDALVEVASSASEWEPTPMAREGNAFVARLVLPSGPHRIAIRVNRTPWRAPRGLSSLTDDFGSTSGLIIIP